MRVTRAKDHPAARSPLEEAMPSGRFDIATPTSRGMLTPPWSTVSPRRWATSRPVMRRSSSAPAPLGCPTRPVPPTPETVTTAERVGDAYYLDCTLLKFFHAGGSDVPTGRWTLGERRRGRQILKENIH
jgi:hypothetical protein